MSNDESTFQPFNMQTFQPLWGKRMPDGFAIRPFEPADEPAVIALWARCELVRPWNDPRKDIERKLQVQPELFLVGLLDGAIVPAAKTIKPCQCEGDIAVLAGIEAGSLDAGRLRLVELAGVVAELVQVQLDLAHAGVGARELGIDLQRLRKQLAGFDGDAFLRRTEQFLAPLQVQQISVQILDFGAVQSLPRVRRQRQLELCDDRIGDLQLDREHIRHFTVEGLAQLVVAVALGKGGRAAYFVELEIGDRTQRRIERNRLSSDLPGEKTLATLDRQRLPAPVAKQLPVLCDGAFLERGDNVLLFGLPGRGKTHLACALGNELVRRGHRILFSPTYALVQRLLAAKRDLRLEKYLTTLDGFDAIILDDLGYVQQSRDEMEVLFTFLAERYERRSVFITSNLIFAHWDRIFRDQMATAAAIDRLVHHSVLLEFDVPSFRTEQATRRGKATPRQAAVPTS